MNILILFDRLAKKIIRIYRKNCLKQKYGVITINFSLWEKSI